MRRMSGSKTVVFILEALRAALAVRAKDDPQFCSRWLQWDIHGGGGSIPLHKEALAIEITLLNGETVRATCALALLERPAANLLKARIGIAPLDYRMEEFENNRIYECQPAGVDLLVVPAYPTNMANPNKAYQVTPSGQVKEIDS
jgi:hypothetical protein